MTAQLTGILEPSPLGMDAVVGPGTFTPPVVLSPEDPFGLADGDAVRTEWYVTGPEPVTVAQVLAINDLGSVVTSRAVALDPASLQAFPRATVPMDPGTLAAVVGVLAGVMLAAVIRVAARGWASPLMFPDLRIPWLALSGLFLAGVIAVTLAAWWRPPVRGVGGARDRRHPTHRHHGSR